MSGLPLSKGANQFAIDLFHCYLQRHGDKYRNLLLCPYLIYHSLAMMLVGAKGQTAEQLMRLLRIPPTPGAQPSSSSAAAAAGNTTSSPSTMASSICKPTSTRVATPSPSSSTSGGSSIAEIQEDSSLMSPTVAGRHPHQSPVSGGQRSPHARRRSPRASAKSSSGAARSASAGSHRTSGSGGGGGGSRMGAAPSYVSTSARQLTPDADEARHREFLMLTEQLLHGNHDFVHLASFIYLDKGTKRTERYKSILRDYYETKPKKIDFDNVDLMVKTINEDVARTTENIYNDVLSKQEAQKLEKSYMLLVNAVFFRGFWLSNFTDVKKAPFYKYPPSKDNPSAAAAAAAAANSQKKAPPAAGPSQYSVNMMSKLDYLPVVADEQLDARIVKMPFEASDLQMLLLLPNNAKSDSTYLCESISETKISQIIEQFSKSKCKTVRVSMPIFCIDSGKISIQSTLVQMGASDLFDKSRASMSGVCDNKQVWLHKIIHRCFIVCDNRGSITSSGFEKARRRQAQLEGGISSGRSGVDEFVADHPFMYIIFDSLTKTILLIGLYTDPSETLEVIHESQLSADEAHQIYTEGVYKT